MGPEAIREVRHHSADEGYFFVTAAYILEERGIWDSVKWRDGTISIHTSLGPEHPGRMGRLDVLPAKILRVLIRKTGSRLSGLH